jgi:glycerol uptake facilitator-like aquaporin
MRWPEYLMEAAGLAQFMISAGLFGTLLEYPQSPVHRAIADLFFRRSLMGVAMGLTAVAVVYSPWGKQSGAHINPAATLTFWRLGKVAGWDEVFYAAAQFVGGVAGVLLASAVVGNRWNALWVYFSASLLGMLASAESYLWLRRSAAVHCAKMHDQNNNRCIFCVSRAPSQIGEPPKKKPGLASFSIGSHTASA